MDETSEASSSGDAPVRRCDLHLHTRHSAWKHLRVIRARDSYTDPRVVFERAKAAGMDFVAVTDHDSLEGALRLIDSLPGRRDEIIVGEEVETYFPDTGQWIHVNVYGLDEADHREIHRLKGSVHELVPFLRRRGLLHVLNHPFQSYRFQKPPHAYVEEILDLFSHFEVGNSTMPAAHAAAAGAMLRYAGELLGRKVGVAGSDAHVPGHIGSAYTAAPGRTAAEYLENVAAGNCSQRARSVGVTGLLRSVYSAVGSYYGELRTAEGRAGMTFFNYLAAAGLAPGAAIGVPAALTFLNDLRQRGVARWVRRSLERPAPEPRAGLAGILRTDTGAGPPSAACER
jgi:predicted metal-dependent phosphoesterase TrpH